MRATETVYFTGRSRNEGSCLAIGAITTHGDDVDIMIPRGRKASYNHCQSQHSESSYLRSACALDETYTPLLSPNSTRQLVSP
mmetsp:Transcript_6294/g.12521  ORF Transcript_6294/g.12521 Transcript_6294/m.12521 type:complete len:83 (-) Transcript_6294:274-522(-)